MFFYFFFYYRFKFKLTRKIVDEKTTRKKMSLFYLQIEYPYHSDIYSIRISARLMVLKTEF